MLKELEKWWALRSYRRRLGPLLRKRYGRSPHGYTPQQVLTTLRVHGMNTTLAPHACVMFCSPKAYSEFTTKLREPGGRAFDQGVSPIPPNFLYLGEWPEHHTIANEIGNAPSHRADFGSSHFAGGSLDFSGGDFADSGSGSDGAGGDGSTP